MRIVACFAAFLVVTGLTGCFGGKHQNPRPAAVVDFSHPAGNQPAASATNAPAEKFLVTPDDAVSGRVASVNENLRFVVLTFPLGELPPVDSRMNVFRNGSIVGEIKVTGPQRDNNSVADIVLGDARKGDEVRQK